MSINHRENPTFNPMYALSSREDDSQAALTPAVAVYGAGNPSPFLGVGKIIGSIQRSFSTGSDIQVPCAVIEVEDTKNGQPYTLLETQVWCEHPIPEQTIDDIIAGTIAVTSVCEYLKTQQL